MPNMFGGDQSHPAYDPRVQLGPDQVLIGNDLYTLEVKNGRVLDWVAVENVDGSTCKILVSKSPRRVRSRAEKINAVGALNGLHRVLPRASAR